MRTSSLNTRIVNVAIGDDRCAASTAVSPFQPRGDPAALPQLRRRAIEPRTGSNSQAASGAGDLEASCFSAVRPIDVWHQTAGEALGSQHEVLSVVHESAMAD
jgi:hypothetical protein